MFEWQKEKIKKLEVEREILISELDNNIKDKEKLERLDNVYKYKELLEDDDVKRYISLLDVINRKKESISLRDFSIQRFKEDICYHSFLYFISDVSSDDDRDVYECRCLKCGLISKFKFYGGKRINCVLIRKKNYSYDMALNDYKEMEAKGFSEEEIMEMFNEERNLKKRVLNRK